jgi:hypothetical protein
MGYGDGSGTLHNWTNVRNVVNKMERNKSLRELLQDEFKDLFPYVPLTGAEYAAYLSAIKKWLTHIRLSQYQKELMPSNWRLARISMLDELLEELK